MMKTRAVSYCERTFSLSVGTLYKCTRFCMLTHVRKTARVSVLEYFVNQQK